MAFVRLGKGALGTVASLAMLALSSTAAAEAPLQRRIALMSTTQEKLAANSNGAGSAVLPLALGVLYTSAGAYVAFDRHEPGRDAAWRGLAVTGAVLIGTISFSAGIYALAPGSTISTLRRAHFQRDVRLGRMNEVLLARYEGELYSDAVRAYVNRRESGWLFGGGAVGGAGLVAIAATSDLRGDARGLIYAEGGVLSAYCLYASIASFNTESEVERLWRFYRAAQPRPASGSTSWSIVPLAARGSAGLAAVGSF